MVKPINKHNFGPTGMGVGFNDGTATATGYVLRQTGTNKFVVTADPPNTPNPKRVQMNLAQTTANATGLTKGLGTIAITTDAGTEHVARIWDSRVRTTEGKTRKWSLGGTPTSSKAVIGAYEAPGGTEAFSVEPEAAEPEAAEPEATETTPKRQRRS